MGRITKKQRVFIEEYLQCWNAAEAARRAGYSERTARIQASRLLSKANILAEVEKRINEKAMSADEVLIRLAEQARCSIEDFITIYGDTPNQWNLNIPRAIREGKGHLIKSIVPTQHGIRIELVDKQKALELLGRHHSLFTDKVEHSGDVSVNVSVEWDDANDNDTS